MIALLVGQGATKCADGGSGCDNSVGCGDGVVDILVKATLAELRALLIQ
jgi:hypothetical protein